MKGDFSRFTYDPRRHYSRVLLQQGRVQTDADWNEQGEIAQARHAAGLRDLIGRSGVPRDRAGFGITAHGGLHFDGKQSLEIDVAHGGDFAGDDYTIEAWIKLGAPGPATLLRRVDRGPAAPDVGGFRFGLTADGRLRFERLEMRDAALVEIQEFEIDAWGDLVEDDLVIEVERVSRHRIVGRHRLASGDFHHVAAVCGAGELVLMVDGEIDHRRRAGGGLPFAAAPLLVGCDRPGPAAPHFAGVIDRLRLWRRALDPDAVRAAMRADRRRDVDPDCLWLLDLNRGPSHTHRPHDADPTPRRAVPDIRIGAGRCYVDGILCENDASVPYDGQPDCPGLTLPDATAEAGPYLVYLDTWERIVSALEDEAIREPALGGPDTAARLRTISQVRMVRLPDDAPAVVPPRPSRGTLTVSTSPGDVLTENRLYRIEIHDSGVAAGDAAGCGEGDGLPVIAVNDRIVTVSRPRDDERRWAPDQQVALTRSSPASAVIATIASVPPSPRPDTLALELRLAAADAEALAGDPTAWRLRPVATFKWSRDNGAWAFAIRSIEPDLMTLQVDDPNGIGDMLRKGDWVEVVDDATVLRGRAPPLCRIVAVTQGDDAGYTIGLDRPALADTEHTDVAAVARPRVLRPWDSINGTGPGALGVEPVVVAADSNASTTALDNGIEIAFGPGHYATGDYWVIPVRERVQWPADAGGTPLAQPPHGIAHHCAELALIRFAGSTVEVDDLRPVFAPLTDLADAPAAAPAARTAPAAAMPDLVPSGFAVFGATPEPPSGWRFTGGRLALRRADPKFYRLPLRPPAVGAVRAAALAAQIFCLMDDGALWALDPALAGESAWTACRPLPDDAREGAVLAAFEGRLHALGGHGPDERASALHHSYDPQADTWQTLAPLGIGCTALAAAALGERLFAIGGRAARHGEILAKCESYASRDDRWEARPPLPHATAGAAAAASGGRLYVFGGHVAHLLGLLHPVSAEVHVFSPSADQWSGAAPMAVARSGDAAVASEDRIHVIGGERGPGDPAPAELLDVATGRWIEAPQPEEPRCAAGLTMLDGTIHLIGGITAGAPNVSIEACAIEQVLYIHQRPPADE